MSRGCIWSTSVQEHPEDGELVNMTEKEKREEEERLWRLGYLKPGGEKFHIGVDVQAYPAPWPKPLRGLAVRRPSEVH